MSRTCDIPATSFRGRIVPATFKTASKFRKNLAWPIFPLSSACTAGAMRSCLMGPVAAWFFPAEKGLSASHSPWLHSSESASPPPPLPPGSWSWGLEVGGHCSAWLFCLPLMTAPAESGLYRCTFPAKSPSEKKGKAILTSDLHSCPSVQCCFWLFSCV